MKFNIAVAGTYCTNLLGPAAVASHKTEHGRRLTQIGYDFDLDTSLIEISEKNRARAFVGFLTAAADGRATVKQMERLASWACRYSDICSYMRPFVSVLYRSYMGKSTQGLFVLSEGELLAIRLFRLLFLMTALVPGRFCRTMQSFSLAAASAVVEYDTSLSGVGVIIYRRTCGQEDYPLGGVSVDISDLGFGEDSQYQNTAEFTAAIIGICILAQILPDCHDFVFRGDSMSALSWARNGRCKSTLVSNAAVVYTSLVVHLGLNIVSTEHLSSEDNWRFCRRFSGRRLEVAVHEGSAPQL